MERNLVHIEDIQPVWNASRNRILKYTIEIYHSGLNEHKLISAPQEKMLKNKADIQIQRWNERWEIISAKRISHDTKEVKLEQARSNSKEAYAAMEQIDNLLLSSLSSSSILDFDTLKSEVEFPESYPKKPTKIEHKKEPAKPDKNSPSFNPRLSILDKLIKSRKEKKLQSIENKYHTAVKKWEKLQASISEANQQKDKEYIMQVELWEKECLEWEERKRHFIEQQDAFNLEVDDMKATYMQLNSNSIVRYCDLVLNNSDYPDTFPKSFELEYNSETKILIVEYQLPALESFPVVKEVKYIAIHDEFKEVHISNPQLNKIYDDALYKITLRTLHELFESDLANAIEAISFNGWVKSVNKATGKEENNCILSIQVKKVDFIEIDLANVDPKICFKNLKGVASSKLSSLTPIQPILQISKSDKRFIEGYAVVGNIDTSTNIAAMDWGDFEHLIRELFEKEFQANGGEVKVTQASRDGGVDAIAFDPDPIRGGKIVIQAKRYTNTVGVSAVRDLYGTVMNEGATKGILVSTADYGPDAYAFARGKPLTLLNGSNLLHLLEKHGHHAKIDLKEAKKLLSEKDEL